MRGEGRGEVGFTLFSYHSHACGVQCKLGAWCSGITSASHAEGPGLNPQCVQLCVASCSIAKAGRGRRVGLSFSFSSPLLSSPLLPCSVLPSPLLSSIPSLCFYPVLWSPLFFSSPLLFSRLLPVLISIYIYICVNGNHSHSHSRSHSHSHPRSLCLLFSFVLSCFLLCSSPSLSLSHIVVIFLFPVALFVLLIWRRCALLQRWSQMMSHLQFEITLLQTPGGLIAQLVRAYG